MKAKYFKDGRVTIELTKREWRELRSAFSFVQADAEGAGDNVQVKAAAAITYRIQETVRAAVTKPTSQIGEEK